jgi:hypothetical protein
VRVSDANLVEGSICEVVFLTYMWFHAGAMFDRYGLRPVIIPGSVGMVASLMCLSVSTSMSEL